MAKEKLRQKTIEDKEENDKVHNGVGDERRSNSTNSSASTAALGTVTPPSNEGSCYYVAGTCISFDRSTCVTGSTVPSPPPPPVPPPLPIVAAPPNSIPNGAAVLGKNQSDNRSALFGEICNFNKNKLKNVKSS